MGHTSWWVLKERKRSVITKTGAWLLVRVILFDDQTMITIEDDQTESSLRFDGIHKYVLNYVQNIEIYDETKFFIDVLYICDVIVSHDIQEVTRLVDEGLVEIIVE